MKYKFVIPEGTRDLTLEDCAMKTKLKKNIENILEKWGYNEIITPTMEYYETFNFGFKKLNEEDVYKLIDNKGRILALRPDMTIPIARVVGSRFKKIKEPIRLRYSADVFRMHESLGGKKNEYTDCGIELIGLEGKKSDFEILTTALDILKILKNTDYKLEIGDINFFNEVVEEMKLTMEERDELADLINRKSVKELEEYLQELDISTDNKEILLELPWLFGGEEVLRKALSIVKTNKLKEIVINLEKIYSMLCELGYENSITFDLGMVPRLDYYTGIIFRGYADGAGATVLSGGRYDNLSAVFGNDVPAIGFSVNVDSMVDALDKTYLEGQDKYKVYYSKNKQVSVMKKAIELRKEGKIVELIPVDNIDGIDVKKEVIYR